MTTYRPAAVPLAPPAVRAPWPGRADVVAQVLLQAAMALVLAAVVVNRLDQHVATEALRTWLADLVALGVLGTAGVLHSLVRRGRAGRWPATAALLVLPAVVLGCPLLVA